MATTMSRARSLSRILISRLGLLSGDHELHIMAAPTAHRRRREDVQLIVMGWTQRSKADRDVDVIIMKIDDGDMPKQDLTLLDG
jgi:hypothetical protein